MSIEPARAAGARPERSDIPHWHVSERLPARIKRRPAHRWRLPALAAAVVGIIIGIVALASSGPTTNPLASAPGAPERSTTLLANAKPADVLGAYLAAFLGGDCAAAAKLAVSSFDIGNGELCGVARIDSYDPVAGPAIVGDEETYPVTLHVTSSSDSTVPTGELQWFYTLAHQPDGSWKLCGGGSGP